MWIHAGKMGSSANAKKCLQANIAKTKEVRETFIPAKQSVDESVAILR